MKINKLALMLIMLLCAVTSGFSQIQFDKGSTFRYLKGSQATNISADWNKTNFDDSGWARGTAPFRYGKGSGGTQLSDMKNNYSTVYLRTTFPGKSVNLIKKIKLTANLDDGFVLWINGKQVHSKNAPASLNYNSLANTTNEYDTEYSVQLSTEDIPLMEGENTIAVLLLNSALSSSDLYFDMQLLGTPQLPGLETTEKVTFSKEAGFYNEPFDLTLSTSSSDYKIVYTVDGSNPSTSSTAVTASTSATIRVDPTSTTNRGKTPAYIVRASLVKDGYSPAFSVSKTYIFPVAVKTQSYPGGSWPKNEVNGQVLDYDMATDVVNSSSYKSQIDAALKEIPSISLSTDNGNLFDASEGIYVNPSEKSENWERDCSVELINPDGEEGFHVNAGLRIRGGNSAKNLSNPKHGFRLFFRSEYGNSKLEYPLFGSNGASEFDCIDLRCEQNYSWSMDGSPNNTMIKDIYCRKLQGLMGQPYSRGFQFHLYLNGMYWGIYQIDERPEASYASTYLGGDKEDYDVIKVNTIPWPYKDEVTDGNMDSWKLLWNLCQKGFDTNEKYFRLEGKDANGNRIDTATVLVDIDNLIDYMLIIFYSGNFDAPVSSWGGNNMPNNFFALYNQKNKSQGFKFVAHDSEHCMFVNSVNIDKGIDENRVNIGSTGAMRITDINDFNPQWLHYKLCSNAEYRLRFADRAYSYLSKGGLLSPDKAKALFHQYVEEIDTAIIAESARWGDAQSWTSLTRDDDWLPEINNLDDNYFPYRTDIVIKQLKDENLYSSMEAPVIKAGDQTIQEDKYTFSGSKEVTISTSATSGDIYYTLNGCDPRLTGGALSGNAINGGKSATITLSTTTRLMARVKSNNSWGPLKQVRFTLTDEDYSKLKVTELNYHPLNEIVDGDTTSDKNFEFIEFKNTGSSYIDMSGLKLDSAVTYTVPDNTLLAPGAFYVVASKTNSFYSRNGVYPNGNYKGQYSNSGEYVLLTDAAGNKIISFTYSDKSPWPPDADGKGYSLTSVEENPTGDPNNYSYWKASSSINGTPFRNDDGTTSGTTVLASNYSIKVYPNPTTRFLTFDLNKPSSAVNGIEVSIFDLNGHVLLQRNIGECTKLDLSGVIQKAGLYIIKAQADNSIFIKKFMFVQ
jgi:hypothetical protein